MHFRISIILCWAVLMGFATATQIQRSSKDFNFNNEDADIEGSGYHGEVTQDLESSGSGLGPDDEDDTDDDKSRSYVPPVNNPVSPGQTETETEKGPVENNPPPVPTEDSTVKMNKKHEDRPASFFAQPGMIAAVIGGAVVGLLCAILVVMFIVYRMRKKDEGSYALGEPKQSPNSNSYSRGTNKEFFA
ncbi:syndecan [Anoplophora glabripennis]|uniref:Syndecan n=1 Tax=Anoplophora glabripennis TaxID=217634 RepID=V5IAV1_ANOGL|nr:syndecan [Anoplophora glabripennis]